MVDFAEVDVKEPFQFLVDRQRSWTVTLPLMLRHQKHLVTGVGVCIGLGVLLQFQILQLSLGIVFLKILLMSGSTGGYSVTRTRSSTTN